MARADIEEPSAMEATPPRLGFVEGDVLFWRPGAGDWEAAQVNLPLAPGDALATRDGKLELQVGGESFVRAGGGTQIRLKSNEPGFLELEVSSGQVAIDVRELKHGHSIQVDTPNAAVAIARDGYYRIDAGNESTRLTVRRGGQAAVTPSGGSVADVGTGEAVEITGTGGARLTALAAPPFDDWDRWNYERAGRFLAAPRSYAVSSDVYGTDDLERSGSWQYVNTYGRVWVPTAVPAGWAPYTYGRWAWDPLYGWAWVDFAPWGWAPFHYGRWVYPGFWAWAPGPVVAAPIYSPALVAFFGWPGFSVGIGFPFVSWVGLGWGEPLVPWWGPVGFIGRPCWWGWGGPRIVNNVVINNTTVVNANSINFWRNMHAPGAVVSVPKDQFDTHALDRARLTHVNVNDLMPLHGALPVAAKGPSAGAPGSPAKMPMPNFGAARPLTEAQRGAPGADFSRQAGTTQRPAPPVAGQAKVGSTSAMSALAAVRARGPGALTVPPYRPAELTRGEAPPPVPGAQKNTAASGAFDALHSRGPSVPGSTGTASNSFARTGSSPAPVNQFNRSPVNQFSRSASSPPPVPRRVAALGRGSTGSSGWGRPAAFPQSRMFGAPSRISVPPPSVGRQGFSRPGGYGAPPGGGMSRSAAVAPSAPARSVGMVGGFHGGMHGR
jgi:hypothetical protein